MVADLDGTGDPRELVPGNPGAVAATIAAMRGYGDVLHEAGAGLKRIDTTDGWSGRAGDAFREVFHGQPGKWLQAGDCFHDAASALENYNSTLSWAQGQATDAIQQWNAGQAATSRAIAEHGQAERQAGHDLPFNDPGAAQRQATRETLERARDQLSGVGDSAARLVGAARDLAPELPGFWSEVGDVAEDFGAGVAKFAGGVVNSVASLGNAIVNCPRRRGGSGVVVSDTCVWSDCSGSGVVRR